ncbi:hypothetical protein [Nitrosospira sp. NRS527]|uniref:hypothetical protein n=1 Tax=Nitrosospira sp. NRS527 TaxID=155925 RepID=UPI001FD0C4F1|nr:hypothetical protein [Nitrosospira sp. NRS527]
MPAGHDPEIIQLGNAGKNHEAAQVVFIRAPRLWIIDIGEPTLDRRSHFGQLAKLDGGQDRSVGYNWQIGSSGIFKVRKKGIQGWFYP